MVLSERPTTYKIIHFGASTIDLPIQKLLWYKEIN